MNIAPALDTGKHQKGGVDNIEGFITLVNAVPGNACVITSGLPLVAAHGVVAAHHAIRRALVDEILASWHVHRP